MTTLSVGDADLSGTKQKAIEDAKNMQESIDRECADAGKEPPPYVLCELIGKGSFGRVYKASSKISDQLVAAKIISIDEGDSLAPGAADTFHDILKEVNTLKRLSECGAKNVNTVVDTLLVGSSVWMITEFCAGGSVSTLMRPSGGLPEKWIIPILREVAEALFWVHKEGIIHRDVKCANVLVCENGSVQLCDFGVAGIIENKFDKRSTVTGTLNWMAPELFDSSVAYGTEVDIWAFGSLAFEAATGLPPNARNMARINIPQFGSYLKDHCPRLEGDQFSQNLKDMVAFCMVEDPKQRPPIEKVQKHPYIFNTAEQYPTESLSMLVKSYRLWEIQGGNRMSLFNAGGAQGLADSQTSSSASDDDGWNFNTISSDLDSFTFDDSDAETIHDAKGPSVDTPSPPPPSRIHSRRRRPPPIMRAITAPLEKVFDPNTITDYMQNANLFYGRVMPTSAPDFPLQDSPSPKGEKPRDSLIDLDMSLDGERLSRFVDTMETIKASRTSAPAEKDAIRDSIRESLIDLDASLDGGRLSRFADLNMETIKASPRPPSPPPEEEEQATKPDRPPTREWAFPVAATAHINLEGQWFQTNEADDDYMALDAITTSGLPRRPSRPVLEDDYEDAVSPSTVAPPPLPAPPDQSRFSATSLIDLDASLAIDETPRPSTATSDAASTASSMWRQPFQESTTTGSFDHALQRQQQQQLSQFSSEPEPELLSTNREPSLYVSDDLGLGSVGAPSTPVSETILTPPSDAEDMQPAPPVQVPLSFLQSVAVGGDGPLPSNGTTIPRSRSMSRSRSRSGSGWADGPRAAAGGSGSGSGLGLGVASSSASSGSGSSSGRVTSAGGPTLPPTPLPPSAAVLQGMGSADEVREELQRMIRSLHEHLSYSASVLRELPARSQAQVQAAQQAQEQAQVMI